MSFVAVAEDVEISLAHSDVGSFSPSPVQILCRVGLVGAVHFFGGFPVKAFDFWILYRIYNA